jgi:hypothetical protein
MHRWERLQQYLFDHDRDNTHFTAVEYAAATGLSTEEATADIQSYLSAQRIPPRRNKDGDEIARSATLYVLHRLPGTRTRNAQWAVGTRAANRKALGLALYDDTLRHAERAFQPDLVRLRQINPRQAKQVERQINMVLRGAMQVLRGAAQGVAEEE